MNALLFGIELVVHNPYFAWDTHMTAKIIYVLYLIVSNATGVTITTIKLNIQLPEVASALAGARIRRGTYRNVSECLCAKQ